MPHTKAKIEDITTRAVADLIDPDSKFVEKLEKKAQGEIDDPVVIKLGVDPTRPDIHLGHAVILRKLRTLQDLGCKVVFIVGDFTAQIGDPTGKSKVRPEISQQEIEANMKTYIDQVGKIIRTDEEVFSWIRNSDWFTAISDITPSGGKLNLKVKKGPLSLDAPINPQSFLGKALVFERTRMQKRVGGDQSKVTTITLRNFFWTLRHITHARLIQRDMFQERLNSGRELYMHEMLYPVLQGIDSYVIHQIYGSCDLEIGGTDQLFNMLMGRDVMNMNKETPQAVMTIDLLVGTDGSEKMSKSLDNFISIIDEPDEMYGKLMSVPDELITHYFELATYEPLEEIEKIKETLTSGDTNPKDIKMRLAREVVEIYHGPEEAQSAEESFETTFSQGEIPENVTELEFSEGQEFAELVVNAGLVPSKSQFRRLVDQGAITNLKTNQKMREYDLVPEDGTTYRVGKTRFVKTTLSR